MFASLGIDLSSAATQEGLGKIQRIITTLQKSVYSLEGSLNKLVMDDKGSTIICIWGLSPFAHDDDAVRAVLCAIRLRKELGSPDLNCTCNIGISTGVVFAGVVGTSGFRKEYSVIGDIVNLSARIMNWPKAVENSYGNIYVDRQTKQDASHKIRFQYKTHAAFKGKSLKLPIYAPIDPDLELSTVRMERNRGLLIHSNPFLFDHSSRFQYMESEMIGRHKLRETANADFNNFLETLERPAVGVISGAPGIGKTLFARALAEDIEKIAVGRVRIFASHLNPISEKRYLNNWRCVLAAMVQDLASKAGIQKNELVEKMIKAKEEELNVNDKLSIIEDLLSIKLPSGYKMDTQYQLLASPVNFAKKEEYPEDVLESLFPFFLHLFQIFTEACTAVIFLDDSSRMDKESWKLLYEIQANVENVFIYAILRQNDQGELEFPSTEICTYYRTLEASNLVLEPYSLTGLLDVQVMGILERFGRLRVQEAEDEIALMLPDLADQELLKVRKIELAKQMGVSAPIKGIDRDVLRTVVEKTEGNAVMVFEFILALIKGKYLENHVGVLMPTENFKKAKQLDDWGFVGVPDLALRINSKQIDKLGKTGSIKDIVCLKAASVIGQVFTLRQLKHISPLRTEGMIDLLKRASGLEEGKIVEIIDDDGVSDMTCRFLPPFFRETLYQRLLYREQKKGLHTLAAEHLLNNSLLIGENPENECQRMITHLLLSEDVGKVENLTVKSKRLITIKKLSNLLQKDCHVLKSGLLLKQGSALKKRSEA